MNRISRHQLFMGLAETFAARGTCPRRQVGCVIVSDRHVISHGYNGAPAGMPHCLDVGCGGGIRNPTSPVYPGDGPEFVFPNGCTRAIHAEANAIAYAAAQGVSLESGVMYTTCEPCLHCAQLIITAGLVVVVFKDPYRMHDGIDLLQEAGIDAILYAQLIENDRRANEDTEVT